MVCHWIEQNPRISKLKTLSLQTRDVIASIDVERPDTPYCLTPDDKHVVFPGEDQLYIYEADTGNLVDKFPFHKRNGNLTLRCITISDNCSHIAVGVRYDKPKNCRGNKWRRQTHIFMVDLSLRACVDTAKVEGRQHVRNLYFVHEDTRLLTVFKDKVIVYSVPDMRELYRLRDVGEIHQHIYTVCHASHRLLAGVSHDRHVKLMYFNYKTYEHTYSGAVNYKQYTELHDPHTRLFGLYCSREGKHVMIGHSTAAISSPLVHHVLSWLDIHNNTIVDILLTGNSGINACSLLVDQLCTKAFVGWHDGKITIVDLESRLEVKCFQGHSHQINDIKLVENDQRLLTFSQDHTVKMWDIDALCLHSEGSSHNENLQTNSSQADEDISNSGVLLSRDLSSTTSRDSILSSPPVDSTTLRFNDSEVCKLSETEECLGLSVSDGLLLTCPARGEHACKLWSLEDGVLAHQYQHLQEQYHSSLENHKLKHESKTHGSVKYLGQSDGKDCIVYERKQRDSLCVSYFLLDPVGRSEVVSHEMFKDTYIRLLYRCNADNNHLTGTATSYRMVLIRRGKLEVRSLPHFELLQSIDIPVIEDTFKITTSAGKRRLACLKLGITLDGKYITIANTRVSEKYVHLVDLKHEKCIEQISLPNDVHEVFMSDGIYILIFFVHEHEEAQKAVIKFTNTSDCIEKMSKLNYELKYISALYINSSTISHDRTLGMDIDNHMNVASLWNMSNFSMVTRFEGHLHDIISSDISRDNNFVVTGSYDKTTRVWSALSGECLCLFHATGAVDQVQFSPSLTYLACLCYAAPHRKQALILKVRNIQNKKESSKHKQIRQHENFPLNEQH